MLSIVVEHATGQTTRWGPDEPDGEFVPKSLKFSTSIPGGFKTMNCTLLRDLSKDQPDINLFDTVTVYGPGTEIAWQGRIAQTPKLHGNTESIDVGCVGWSAGLEDDKFRQVYVNRDFAQWKGPSVQRQLDLTGSFTTVTGITTSDETTGQNAHASEITGDWAAVGKPYSTSVYWGNGVELSSIYFAWKSSSDLSADANWIWEVFLSDDDVYSNLNTTGDLQAAGPGTGTLTASSDIKYYGTVAFYYTAGPAGSANNKDVIFWTVLAVYGNHGLTKQGTESATSAKGFFASDIIKNIVDNYAPEVTYTSTSVQDTSFVIPHAVFKDKPVTPMEAISKINAYQRYDFAVWEDKIFHYTEPGDGTSYDWEMRRDEGVHIDLTGEVSDQLFNGVYVNYRDPSGIQLLVGPDDDAVLKDTTTSNELNKHGLTKREVLDIGPTTTLAGATELGRRWLLDHSKTIQRGTVKVKGTARTAAGVARPVWKMRAGEFVRVSDLDSINRKIVETTYDHDTQEMTCQLDNSTFRLDVILERLDVVLKGVIS